MFNSLLRAALFGQFIGFGLHGASQVSDWCLHLWGTPSDVHTLATVSIYFTIVSSLLGDGSYYALHRLMHRVPLLWDFHSVHHSATHLTPLTQLRLHPVEMLLNNLRTALVFTLVGGTASYLAGPSLNETHFLGAHAVLTLFYATGASLRHSHIRLSYGPRWERWLISPAQHQLHHSEAAEHHHANFGSKFAIWDRLGGTLQFASSKQRIRFGLGDRQPFSQSTTGELLRPFLTIDREKKPKKKSAKDTAAGLDKCPI